MLEILKYAFLWIALAVSASAIIYLKWRFLSRMIRHAFHSGERPSPNSDAARVEFMAASFQRLADLHDSKVLTDEEFAAAKAKVIESPYIRKSS